MKTKTEIKNESWKQFKKYLVLPTLMLLAAQQLSFQSLAAPGDLDLSFDPGSSIDGSAPAIAVQSDGKVVIGGIFTTVHNNLCTGLARLNSDGSLDESFHVQLTSIPLSATPSVRSIVLQNDGKIVIGGSFNTVNGVARTNLARLNADGSLDDTFLNGLGGADQIINCVLLDHDGKIFIGGRFTSFNGVGVAALARLNADGSLDAAFDVEFSGVNLFVRSIALSSDGKIIINGSFTIEGYHANVARLKEDGSLDAILLDLPEDQGVILALAVQGDGKVLVGGWFNQIDGMAKCVTRLNPDGSVDDSFTNNTFTTLGIMVSIETIALQDDGKIIIGGSFSSINGVTLSQLARLNADGTLDDLFSSDLQSYEEIYGVWGLALQSDGRIIVTGGNETGGFWPGNFLFRLNSDGSTDHTFDPGPTGPLSTVYCAATQPDGRMVIGGSFSTVNGLSRDRVARLIPDGSLDRSFLEGISGADFDVRSLALQSDGKILIGGEFKSVNGIERTGVARLNADGSLDLSFSNNLGGYVYALGLQSDGKIIAGGQNRANGRNLARLNPDGSTDSTFSNTLSASWGMITCMAFQSDGKIVIGGFFTSVNGITRNRIARINPNGSLDTSFLNGLAGMDQAIWSIAIQADGKILVGGWFSSVNGVARNGFARLNSDGSLDTSFLATGPNPQAIAMQRDGKILVGGDFSVFNGSPREKLARLNPDGSLDDTFLAGTSSPFGLVQFINVQNDLKIIVGGRFSSVNQTPRSFIARLMGDFSPPTITNQSASQTAESGTTIELATGASGVNPMSYLWFFNGTNVASMATTNSVLLLTNLQISQSGSYTVVITNYSGSLTSAPAMLQVIPKVERRPVPAINITGAIGSVLNLDYASALKPTPDWSPLASVDLTSPSQFYFDLTQPLPPQRFYRVWQTGAPLVIPSLDLHFVSAITLTGNIGDSLRIDYINQFGPTDAWMTLATVTLTNMSQLYFDVSSIGQPPRLWRIVPVP